MTTISIAPDKPLSAVWSYAAGDDDSVDLSDRFIPVHHQSSRSLPDIGKEEEPQSATIEEEPISDHEDVEVPLESTQPASPQEKRNNFSDSKDDEEQTTPRDLLSQLLPVRVKEAQAAVTSAQQKDSSAMRANLYSMSRSDIKSTLRQSMFKLDSFDADTLDLTGAPSWSGGFNRHDQGPSLADKKKWGVSGLAAELLGDGAKKKKKKSSKKSDKSRTKDKKVAGGLKTSVSCPATHKLHKEERKKKKKVSSGSSVRRTKDSSSKKKTADKKSSDGSKEFKKKESKKSSTSKLNTTETQ